MSGGRRAAAGALLLGAALFGAAAFIWHDHHSTGPLAEATTLIIPRGAGFRGAVSVLQEAGVIRYQVFFMAMAAASGQAGKFKAGEYAFTAGMTAAEVMEMIAAGRVVPHKFTLPEGLTVGEALARLAAEPALMGELEDGVEEGSLLPETYHFIYGDRRTDMIGRMQRDMAALVAELWEKRKEGLPLDTPQQALILASVVEKETGVEGERGQVAAVFVNRLRRGMKLQSDPTVAYAIEKDKGPLGRELTLNDLEYDSPYNTYKYAGLPPAPIANPGRAALEAVLNPPETNDLYFVATGEGGHYFSGSLKEHNGNVRQYRRKLRQQHQQP